MARDPFRYIYLRQERLWWTCYAHIFLKWNRQWRELVLWWDLPSSSGQGYRMQDSSQTPWGLRWWWRGLWGGQITRYLEANSQIDQGGARALEGRGDCQDFLSGTQLVGQTKQKGFCFYIYIYIYTFVFRKNLNILTQKLGPHWKFQVIFCKCAKSLIILFTNIYQKPWKLTCPTLTNCFFWSFWRWGTKECRIMNNSASGCLKNICQSVIGKTSSAIVGIYFTRHRQHLQMFWVFPRNQLPHSCSHHKYAFIAAVVGDFLEFTDLIFGCAVRAFSSCSKWVLVFLAGHRLLSG